MKDHIIHWNVDPAIFTIADTFPIRYYGLSWVLGLGLGYYIVKWTYKRENASLENFERLAMALFIGALLGARLGHCFFYEPWYYFQNPLEILLPIKKVGDTFQFIGFQGLASHGGIIGVIVAMIVHSKRTATPLLWIMDRVVIGGAVTGALIRIGNFMNSEILGKPTNTNWGVVFERVDMLPRHPAQLYEAFAYLLIFAVLMVIYTSKRIHTPNGLLVGLLLVLLFSTRFIIEFYKENQVGFEDGMTLNMGQILSIPLVVLGVLIMGFGKKQWIVRT